MHEIPSVFTQQYHYSDVIMGTLGPQITSPTIVYSIVCSGADQRKHQSSASLAFVRGTRRWPVNSPHKGPVSRKKFPFDGVIMKRFCFIVKEFNSARGAYHHIWMSQKTSCLLFMMMSSKGDSSVVTGPLWGESSGYRLIPLTKGQWRWALMFSLICAWTNDWVNSRDAGNLRRHRAHDDVTVMNVWNAVKFFWFLSYFFQE